MLKPDYIDHMTDGVQSAIDAWTLRLISIYAALVGSLSEDDDMSTAAVKANAAKKTIDKEQPKHLSVIQKAVVGAVSGALSLSLNDDLGAIGSTLNRMPKSLRERLHASSAATVKGVTEIIMRDNLEMPKAMQKSYLNAVAAAIAETNSSAKSFEDATRDAVIKMSNKGVAIVDYRSGAFAQADVAARRHVRTQTVQAGANRTLAVLEETGHDLVQTSSHGGSRKGHARWQGRIFSLSGRSKKYPDFYRATGYGSVDGLCGANCKHSFGIYIEGQEKRYPDTPDKSDGDREERYQATQRQRYFERNIRKNKREAAALEAAGFDNAKQRLRLGDYQKGQREHIKKYPYLSREYARERVSEHGEKRVYPLISKPDIQIGRSVGAAAYRDNVKLPDGSYTKISEGTRITKVVTMAGKGTGRKIDVEIHLCDNYGGKRGEWEKRRGNGYVDDLGMKRPCELHWFEEDSVGRARSDS